VGVGLALVLVAALIPGALADPGGDDFSYISDGGDGSLYAPGGEVRDIQAEAEELQLQTEPPADVALDTDGFNESDLAGLGSTELGTPRADGPKRAATDLSEPAVTGAQAGDTELTDAGAGGGASQAPLADVAVQGDTPEPDAVAQLGPDAATARQGGDGGTAEQKATPGAAADSPSGSRQDPEPADPAAAFDARRREGRIQDLIRDVKGVDGGPVSRETAAAAADAMTEVENEFHGRISRAIEYSASALVAGQDSPIARATEDGKDAVISLWVGAQSLAAAHALGYADAGTASALSREAAEPAGAASATAALSAVLFVQGDLAEATKLAGEAAQGYAEATKLAAQAAQGVRDLSPAPVPGSLGWLAPGLGKPFEAVYSLLTATHRAADAAGDNPAARAAAAEARATVRQLQTGRIRKP
jgi:hypothetical protein